MNFLEGSMVLAALLLGVTGDIFEKSYLTSDSFGLITTKTMKGLHMCSSFCQSIPGCDGFKQDQGFCTLIELRPLLQENQEAIEVFVRQNPSLLDSVAHFVNVFDGFTDWSSNPSRSLPQVFPSPVRINAVYGSPFESGHLLCGGYIPAVGTLNVADCWYYELGSSTVLPKPPMPSIIRRAAMVSILGGDAWISGGIVSGTMQDQSWIFARSTHTWVPGPDLPQAVMRHCVSNLDPEQTKFVLVGGNLNSGMDASRTSWLYDFQADEWNNGPELSLPRSYINGACARIPDGLGRPIVMVAGGRLDFNTLANDSEYLNILDMRWERGPSFPIPIGYTNLAFSKNLGTLTFGGKTFTQGSSKTTLKDVFQLNWAQNKWERLEGNSLPFPSHVSYLIPYNSFSAPNPEDN